MNVRSVVLLAELGDYEDDVHSAGDISEFRFVEDQTEEMEREILEKFKHCRYIVLYGALSVCLSVCWRFVTFYINALEMLLLTYLMSVGVRQFTEVY